MKKMFIRLFPVLGMLLISSALFSQDLCAPVGWATQNGGTTGGGNATPITVTTIGELQSQANSSGSKVIYVSGNLGSGVSTRVKVLANKTIIGLPGATLYGGFDIKGSNIIVRNMKVRGPGAVDVDGVDCMTIDGSTTTNVWIDHCEFYDGQDGNLDISNGANYIAITWCKFYYTSASSNHQFCNLIGNSDSKTSDRGKLKVTMMYNWWGTGCKERMPRLRFGQVHVVNNYFNAPGNGHCVRAGKEADILVESNYFESVTKPIDLYENNFTAVTSRNNVFVSTSGNTAGSGTSFTPPYSLSISTASSVKSIVTAGAGANLSSPTSCGGTPPTTYTLTTNSTPSAGGTITKNPNASSYNSGTVVTLTATPAAGYTFTGWSGDASGTSASVNVTMNANKSVTANFQVIPPTTYTLTTNSSPSAGGSVSKNPNASSYNAGTVVTLTATPNSGYAFTGWSGDASGTSASINVTMNANKSVTANFEVVSTGGSTLRIEESSSFTSGFCELDGTIDNNHSGYSGPGFSNADNSTSAGITWKVNAASAGTYQLVWRYANGSGSSRDANVVLNGTAVISSVSFPATSGWTTWVTTIAANVTLSAGVNTIEIQGNTSSGLANIDWIEITGDDPSAASCSGTPPVTYTLTTSASPSSGGSVSGAGTYNDGASASLTATPAAGYSFTGWSGDASGTSATINITMNSNKSVTANFAVIPPTTYTLTTSVSPSSGGSVSGAGTYNSGMVVTVTATPAAGYSFTGWSGDASGTSSSVNVTMSSNKSVTANFAVIPPITYTLTTTASPVAGGTVSGGGTYNSGTVVTLTATANSGYNFTGWSGDAGGSSSSVNVTMSSNKSVIANFQVSGGTPTTIRIEDNAGTSGGLCLYEGSISSNGGADNGKVINLSNSTGKGVNWKIQVPSAGSYDLLWRYVNSSSSNAYAMALIINGVIVNGSQPFPKTSSSSVFSTSAATVSLNAGYNTIRLESIESKATADIDWIEVTGNNPVAANCAASRPSSNAIYIVSNATVEKKAPSVYPNPARGKAMVSFNIAETAPISIKIYDAYGRLVEDRGTKTFIRGTNQVELNLNGKTPGLYTIVLTDKQGVNKILKLIAN